MTAKERLQSYRRLDTLERCKQGAALHDIELLRTLKNSLEAVDGSTLNAAADSLTALIDELAQCTVAYCKEKHKIIDSLNAVTDTTAAEIMQLRYINGLQWSEIADSIGYSERQIMTLHKRALQELEENQKKVV